MGPIGLLLHTGRPLSWFVTIAREAPTTAPPAATHTVSANQLQSLNRLLSRYRQTALWLSLAGISIVGTGVLLSYGTAPGSSPSRAARAWDFSACSAGLGTRSTCFICSAHSSGCA